MRLCVIHVALVLLVIGNIGVEAGTLTNKAFQNFDLKCLPIETISGLTFKKFISSNGTYDLELSLICRSIAGPGDPTPVVTDSDCRYGEKFPLQNNATTPLPNTDCSRNEYINGFLGTYERSYRMIRLRCCRAQNSHVDEVLDCRKVGPDNIIAVSQTGIRDPMQLRTGCPRSVLSSFRVERGKITVGFCALDFEGTKYESYCYSGIRRDSVLADIPTSSKHMIEDSSTYRADPTHKFRSLQPVGVGEETQYGQSFQVECPQDQAFDQAECRYVRGIDGPDLLLRFTCKPVTNEAQKAIRKRITKFARSNDTGTSFCFDNETLCGFYGYYNRSKHLHRRYALACCEGSNWYSTLEDAEDKITTVKADDERQVIGAANGAGANEKLIQTLSFIAENEKVTISTTFQSYHYEPESRFVQSVTRYEYKTVAT